MFAVICTQSWYGPSKTHALELNARDRVVTFASRADAEDYRDHLDTPPNGLPKFLGHNEYAREYSLVRVGSQRFQRAFRRTFGGLEYAA